MIELFEKGNLSEGEQRFVNHMAYNVFLTKMIDGIVPTPPEERARLIDHNGRIILKETVFPGVFKEYLKAMDGIEEKIDELLRKHPGPDGKVLRLRDMPPGDLGDY